MLGTKKKVGWGWQNNNNKKTCFLQQRKANDTVQRRKDQFWGGTGRIHSWERAVDSQDLADGCCCLNIQESRVGADSSPIFLPGCSSISFSLKPPWDAAGGFVPAPALPSRTWHLRWLWCTIISSSLVDTLSSMPHQGSITYRPSLQAMDTFICWCLLCC